MYCQHLTLNLSVIRRNSHSEEECDEEFIQFNWTLRYAQYDKTSLYIYPYHSKECNDEESGK
ncbi:MAG: hypothetical protein MJ231_04585 [bacterium]|nr:hypothetical protein [bacterium]